MSEPVVVISGGSKGLGEGVARDVLEKGGRVATFSRKETPFTLEASRADPDHQRFIWKSIDGTDFPALKTFVREVALKFGRINAVINNAACITEQLLPLTKSEEIHRMVALNLEATLHLTQACVKVMLGQSSGCVINVSSLNAIRGHAGVAVYSATKSGMDGFTRSLARELGPRGIRVNSVAPGYFESDMAAMIGAKEKERIQRRTPLRRLGSVSDMVGLIRFLLSPAAGFITGQTIGVDGGITC